MQIQFTFETEHGVFSDVLLLPDDHALTDSDIDAMKQQRLTNWLQVIDDANNDIPDSDMADEVFPELASARTRNQ